MSYDHDERKTDILGQFLRVLDVNDPNRDKLRDRVPYSAKRLEQMTRKYLSLSPEFHVKRRPQWWMETKPDPIYPPCSRTPAPLPCRPFESGRNCLPGMEAFADQLRR